MFHITNNGRRVRASTISEMMHAAIRGHLASVPDAVLNIETHLFNVVLSADSCEYDIDIGKNVWLNKGRWSRLIKEYFPKDPWERFKSQCIEILTGEARVGATANMMFRDPDRFEKKHRWGGCLMGAVFRGDNHKSGPATLTFYSRTTYIGYMGLLDAAIASVMAKEIAKEYEAKTGTGSGGAALMGFRWHIASSQFHSFKSLPFVYSQLDLMDRLKKYERNRNLVLNKSDKVSPTWHYMAKWYFKVVDRWQEACTDLGDDIQPEHYPAVCAAMLAKEKYGPFKRIQRRWQEHMGYSSKHVPPSLTVDELDLSKAL